MDDRKYNSKRHAEEYLTKPIRRETLKLAVQRLVPNKE
jgi:CheY-like chemotaxis protein